MTQQEYHKLIEIYEVLDSGRIDMAKKMLVLSVNHQKRRMIPFLII